MCVYIINQYNYKPTHTCMHVHPFGSNNVCIKTHLDSFLTTP